MESERFIQLITLKFLNQLTDGERDELNALLKNSAVFRKNNEILKKFWKRKRISSGDNVAMFKRLMDRIEVDDNKTEASTLSEKYISEIPQKKVAKIWYTVAACLAMGIGLLFLYKNSDLLSSSTQSIAQWHQAVTKPRFKKIVKLSDGTIATLNSETTLKYPESFAGNTREVYLNGEAYFDVHKDHKHPFIIHTDKMNVKVLGTAFNVKSYNDEPVSETTLIRGSVEVTLTDRPADRIILKPNEKLIIRNQTAPVKSAEKSATQIDGDSKSTSYLLTNLTYYSNHEKTVIETAWVDNKLTFTNQDFIKLSVLMERWYGCHFEFANEKLKSERFSGIFEKESLIEALEALRIITPFKYRLKGSAVYIY